MKNLIIIRCPFCNEQQKDHWCSGNWKYQNNDVKRFECSCGKNFNHYKSAKSVWTIPKAKFS